MWASNLLQVGAHDPEIAFHRDVGGATSHEDNNSEIPEVPLAVGGCWQRPQEVPTVRAKAWEGRRLDAHGALLTTELTPTQLRRSDWEHSKFPKKSRHLMTYINATVDKLEINMNLNQLQN